ncbi:DUF1491 family protein [Kordiimonas pumila]|uniref:DUF1491 family protein n=1 Tax=Kordiimonas pumila TaxID=2161677 RepID=A0ABV7D9L7_9PROT|nr:DUF1491 family protein [Kordiimonas pumila]
MENRLKTSLWVEAHVRSCFIADMPAFVVARGDSDRGGVLLKINRFSAGISLFEQALDFDGNKVWRTVAEFSGTDERGADLRIAKKRGFDADLWVLEIEDHKALYQPDAPITDM